MGYLVRLGYRDAGDNTEKPLLLTASRGFSTRPTDTPDNTFVAPLVIQPGLLDVGMFDGNRTSGGSRMAHGALVCDNRGRFFDGFRKHAVDGREYAVLFAEDNPENPPAIPDDYFEVFRGTMSRTDITFSTATFLVKDQQAYARLPLTRRKFVAGDRIPEELVGKSMPVLYGWCLNITPVFEQPSLLIYRVNDGAICDVHHVYDGGGWLAKGAAYADEADMLANEPEPGEYRVWREGGCFRLGSPARQVTCDAIEGRWPEDWTITQIMQRIAVDRALRDPATISAADIAAGDAAQPGTIGLFYPTGDVPIQAAFDDASSSGGFWWGDDPSGLFRVQRLELPSGAPAFTITDSDIDEDGFEPISDEGLGDLPAKLVTVHGVPNYTVQTTGLIGQVDMARRARLAQAFIDATAGDDAVEDVHPLAPELEFTSKFICPLDVQAEADRQFAMRGVARPLDQVPIKLKKAMLQQLGRGVVVELKMARFDMENGLLYRVIKYTLDAANGRATLTLWGGVPS